MHNQTADRKMEVRSGAPLRHDVFSMLVRANEEDGGKLPLDDTELVSQLIWTESLVYGGLIDLCQDRECVHTFVRGTRYIYYLTHLLTQTYHNTETTAHTLAAT